MFTLVILFLLAANSWYLIVRSVLIKHLLSSSQEIHTCGAIMKNLTSILNIKILLNPTQLSWIRERFKSEIKSWAGAAAF